MYAVSTPTTILLSASLTLALNLASAAESVGTLSRIEGFALVSQGAQYVPAREGMALKEGDRLMVMDGGNAIVSFADGCQYTLTDDEVLTVGATSTCASDTVPSHKIAPYSAVPQNPSTTADSIRFARAQLGGETLQGIPDWAYPAGFLATLGITVAALPTGSGSSSGFVLPSGGSGSSSGGDFELGTPSP